MSRQIVARIDMMFDRLISISVYPRKSAAKHSNLSLMKICPTCRKTYEDPAIVFCLDDGASLREITNHDPEATWHLPQSPLLPTAASPRPTVPVQATITARPDQFHLGKVDGGDEQATARRSPLPWIFAIVVVLAVSGVLIAWLLSRGGDDHLAKNEVPTPRPTASTLPTESTAEP